MHNDIMVAGLRDRPPMLATKRYAQWQSRFMGYINTKENSVSLRKCILKETFANMSAKNYAHYDAEAEAIHLILTGIKEDIYSAVDACTTARDMWVAVEILQQEWLRFMTVAKQTSDLDKDTYHKLFDILKQYQKEVNEICAKKIARNANPLALVAATQQYTDTTVPVVEARETVQSNDDYNVFANETQHLEQPASINDTYVVETVDSNTIPDSSDMCDNESKADQNAEEYDDEHIVLANLIANLKLDTDENKKIQKQLKKANASLAQELKECKSILDESNRIRDIYLVALHDKEIELEKYKRYHDCTIENDKLERKLKETLALLAQHEIDTKEVLKTKGYEIFVEKEKNDELVK
ncbi:hypothetical protein Tco_0500508 [Tanacetum coccineum]